MKRSFVILTVLFFAMIAISSCKKEYSYEKAAGTLRDSLDNCKPVEIAGQYRKGASLSSDSFYVDVDVNVNKTGAYDINTDTVNGFYFESSGTFQNEGIQTVRLKAQGTPLTDAISLFICSFDTSTCTFKIRVKPDSILIPVNAGPVIDPIEPMADTSLLNTWYFTDLTDQTFHYGFLDEKTNFTKVSPTLNYLNIVGWPGAQGSNNRDTIFTILLYLPGPKIVTGPYPITSGVGGNNALGYANNAYLPDVGAQSFFYFYRSSLNKNKDFIFNIISFDPLQNIILVSFEGTCQFTKLYNDYIGKVHQIKGRFYSKLN